jgi:Uncharacterized conserved protein
MTAPPGQPFIDIERDFDAPRELVYRAYVEPALVQQWLGPRQYTMTIDRWDARAGGELGNGRTRVKTHSIFMSVADRDMMVENGMGAGVDEGFNRLDDLLGTLQPLGAMH